MNFELNRRMSSLCCVRAAPLKPELTPYSLDFGRKIKAYGGFFFSLLPDYGDNSANCPPLGYTCIMMSGIISWLCDVYRHICQREGT